MQTSDAPLRLAALAVLATALAACVTTPRADSNRLALVIGNATYENAPVLNNPVNDATDMCAALARVGFRTMCHPNLRTRAEFEAHVKEYVDQLGPDVVGVFYYSGHGVQAGNANFLIPTTVGPKSVGDNPLRVLYGVDELFENLRQKPAKFQLVILDACRTDLFARTQNNGAPSNLARSLETVAHASYGLAPIKDAPPGTIVLYATASKSAAYDGEGRNGPLTRHVLEHIGTRGLYIEDFFKLVVSGVENETRGYRQRQTPYIYGSFSGRFCFAGCPGDAPTLVTF